MIDRTQVQVLGSDPSVLTFPRTARLDAFGLVPGTMAIRTSGTENWPEVDGTLSRDAQGGTDQSRTPCDANHASPLSSLPVYGGRSHDFYAGSGIGRLY